jgi:polysaccharide export outer membrane protein
MKRNFFLSLLFIFISSCAANKTNQSESLTPGISSTNQKIEIIDNKAYRLDSGDRISIKVFNEDELSTDVLINDSGLINYPHLNEVKLSGFTIAEVEAFIRNGLDGDYLKNPTVQVSILEYRPFYIDGEINNAGAYSYQPGLNVSKAVALAGGFSERASKSDIYIVRANKSHKKIKVSLTTPVYPGDVLTIEESFF